jgi:hypothetical protein
VEPHNLEIKLAPVGRAEVNSLVPPERLFVSDYGLTVRRWVGVAELEKEPSLGESRPPRRLGLHGE